MRHVLVCLVLFAACGGSDEDPHAIGVCEGWVDNLGNPFTGECEAACKKPPASTGDTCDTMVRLNCMAFEFGDERGCCIADGSTIQFHECVP